MRLIFIIVEKISINIRDTFEGGGQQREVCELCERFPGGWRDIDGFLIDEQALSAYQKQY